MEPVPVNNVSKCKVSVEVKSNASAVVIKEVFLQDIINVKSAIKKIELSSFILSNVREMTGVKLS